MINFSAVYAIILRHMQMWKRDINILLGVFYWPLLDIMIWGFLGSWIQKSQTSLPNFEVTAIMGILLWQVVGRGCNIIGFCFTEELWSNNIVNLFTLPLRLKEWIIGVILFSISMILISVIFCMSAAAYFYTLSFWYLLKTFLIFFPGLLCAMIWIGFTCLTIIVWLGKRGVELGFVFGWVLLPFSGAYYPIEVLPLWAQHLSKFLPMSYIFQGMRNYVMYNQSPIALLIKGSALGIIYAIFAIISFALCFKLIKHKGLSRLAD